MPVLKYRTRTLAGLSSLVPEIVYVMCGARAQTGRLPIRGLAQLKYVGFEPERSEYERLSASAGPGFRYQNVAVSGKTGRQTLHVTREPACSSLLRPNSEFFGRFLDAREAAAVIEEPTIETVSLDGYLPEIGITNVDFLELDTQGSELEILRGATSFLSRSVVAIKTETEFVALYEGQPLFADVDQYLRSFGFMLFDLSRSRCRRAILPRNVLTRGQLLWGDAVYLRDYSWFAARSAKPAAFRLCLVAAHLGFHDYALEGIDLLLQGKMGALAAEETEALQGARRQYTTDLGSGARWLQILSGLEAVGLQRPVKALGRLATQLRQRLVTDKEMTRFNWID